MRQLEEVRPALQTGDDGAGLLGNQRAGRQVPDLQAELPIAVEAPGRHVAQVEGGRAEAAYCLLALISKLKRAPMGVSLKMLLSI